MPREFLLLQGTGCRHKKCTFCDYYKDFSDSPFEENQKILKKVTGEAGVLDIINSGSAMELDEKTLDLIYKKAKHLNVHTIWFEAHWMYRNVLDKFRENFKGITIKFRTGVETFNSQLRKSWSKGIEEDVKPEDIAKYFDGVCLLMGVQGQTKEIIQSDIEIALENFEYFSINAFVENSTSIKADYLLLKWFESEIKPHLNNNPKVEILLNNTDLGVG